MVRGSWFVDRADGRSSPRGVMTLPETFSRSFAQVFPDLAGKPVLVALSGGSDSVALLHLFLAACEHLGSEVRAAHVHHHLRGAEADGDAAFCRALCDSLAVPLSVLHLDPVPPRGASPEAWWRSERYRLLEAERERTGCAATATAHTLDDQAETVLLKLLRGAGVRGVAGIRPRRGAVIRPLLGARRETLRAWLREREASWREDASNLAADRPRVHAAPSAAAGARGGVPARSRAPRRVRGDARRGRRLPQPGRDRGRGAARGGPSRGADAGGGAAGAAAPPLGAGSGRRPAARGAAVTRPARGCRAGDPGRQPGRRRPRAPLGAAPPRRHGAPVAAAAAAVRARRGGAAVHDGPARRVRRLASGNPAAAPRRSPRR